MTADHHRKNLTAVVTGASSGIGAETALQLSNLGYDLLLLGRNSKRLEAVQKSLHPQSRSEIAAFDLKDLSKNTSLVEEKLNTLAPCYALINNAGVFKPGTLCETSPETWMEQFQVNLLAAVQLTQLVWPLMKKNNSGSIVNISSTLGVKPSAQTGAYSAIKAAMNNWTLSLAQEGGAHGIRANCICPGIVDTPIHAFHTKPVEEKNKIEKQLSDLQLLPFIGQPTDIAKAICFLVGEDSKWTTGAIFHIDGGINIK